MTLLAPDLVNAAAKDGLEPNLSRYLRFIGYRDGDWIELAALHIRNTAQPIRKTAYAHANSAASCAALLKEADAFAAAGLYIIPNRIHPGVHARGIPNRWNQASEGGTGDRDITARTSFYVDPDPVRPKGVSATEDEKRAALVKSKAILALLSDLVGEDALGFGFSGSGAQISVALDYLEPTKELHAKIKDILDALSRLYTDAAVSIDTSVSEAKRLAPAFGTKKRKGTHVPERPHRPTWFICAETVRRLSLAELDALHASLLERSPPPEKGAPTKAAPSAKSEFSNALKKANEVPIRDVAAKLGLHADPLKCPWCGEGDGSDVAFLDSKGMNVLNCKHARCADRSNRSPVDLVAKIALHCDNLKGTKGVTPEVLRWFGEHFGLEVPARKTRAKASAVDLAIADIQSDKPLDECHYTDTGNAKRLVAKHGAHLRYSATSAIWLVWDGRVWVRDHQDLRVRELAKDVVADLLAEAREVQNPDRRDAMLAHAFRSESRAAIKAMVDLARSMPAVRIEDTDLDAKPLLFNCANGTLDLNTCTLRPHDPKDLLTSIIAYDYDPNAKCPKFAALLERAKPDAAERAFRQRRAGQYLSGNPDKRFIINWGPKDTAKSTYFQIIAGVLAHYAVRVPRSVLEKTYKDEHPAQLMRLANKRFAFGAEIRGRLDIDRIKELTGEADMPARAMGKDWVDIRRLFKLEMYSNDRPQFDFDPEDGMATRVILDPWTVTVPKTEQIDNYHEIILREEAAGVLAWMVEGWREYQRIGLAPPASIMSETKKLTDDLDTFARWLEDEIEVTNDPQDTLDTDDMFERRRDWCKRKGYQPEKNAAWFGRRLGQANIETGRRGQRVGVRLRSSIVARAPEPAIDLDELMDAAVSTPAAAKPKVRLPYQGDLVEGQYKARITHVAIVDDNTYHISVALDGYRGGFVLERRGTREEVEAYVAHAHDGTGATIATVAHQDCEQADAIIRVASIASLHRPAVVSSPMSTEY